MLDLRVGRSKGWSTCQDKNGVVSAALVCSCWLVPWHFNMTTRASSYLGCPPWTGGLMEAFGCL